MDCKSGNHSFISVKEKILNGPNSLLLKFCKWLDESYLGFLILKLEPIKAFPFSNFSHSILVCLW